MIRGEAVEVMRFDGAAWESETVTGVLPGTPTTEGGTSGAASTSVEFHFPKGYGGGLARAWLKWRGRVFQVVGDPQPYPEANVPGRWAMPAKATARDYREPLALKSLGASQDEYGRVSAVAAPLWDGLCREASAEEAEAWRAGSPASEPRLALAAMPDAALLSARPGEAVAEYAGALWDVASVSRTGGTGSEVAIELAGRREP